ncbi:hypothetical protein GCM10028805_32810 [Spirosoma harenae]
MYFKRYSSFCSSLICLALFTLVDGCTGLRNEVDPGELGLESSKLVVTSFLSPQDTLLTAKVTRSSTVVGDSLTMSQTGNNITNATVTLSDGTRSVVLTSTVARSTSATNQSYYRASARLLPIIAGKTYTLTVATPNGQKVTSTCTIPQPVSPTQVTFDSLTENQRRGKTIRYYVQTRWKDPVGEGNAYQVAGIFRYLRIPQGASNCATCLIEDYNSLSFDDDNRGLFTDIGVDGTTMPTPPGKAFMVSSMTGNFFNQYKTASVIIDLMSVEQSYYKFQEAIIRQRRSRNNPFAEPVLIPSNINGGLGCFAGYNNATMTLKLK